VRQVEVQIDEPLLQEIASQTGGKYFRATDNTKLMEIYGEINQMEKNRTTIDSFPVYSELFMRYALIALAALLLELVFKLFVIRRIP
jgi:Ca-activated chloride channel family protein